MDFIFIIGMLAATLTTIAFVPQVVQILRTGNVDGISIYMYMILVSGVALWFTYGIVLKDIPIMLANGITLVLTTTVLGLTLYKRWNKRS
ncbi:MAG: SemiSWEET transporter [Pseudomonadales bacterium]|nr:SemiSWEET transporter [Pseudomonadales bacterium]NRA14810.1 SemiSWEET transporter [Oceanospirillaceae bacterium]